MKLNIRILIYPLIMVMFLMQASSCSKKEVINDPIPSETVTDIDGNVYNTVTLGTQVWMVENLKTTKYRDGTNIPNVTDGIAWANLTTPAYCWYNNDLTVKNNYGALYNEYAVNTGKLCPTGWHVSTENDWNTLISYLGGNDAAGYKIKEKGTTHWLGLNTGATNESGFTALPGGNRLDYDGSAFQGLGYTCGWWGGRGVSYEGKITGWYIDEGTGGSVRCVKD